MSVIVSGVIRVMVFYIVIVCVWRIVVMVCVVVFWILFVCVIWVGY